MTIKIAKLIIHDQCNVSFEGLDPKIRRDCNKLLKFFIHAARHMPAYRLGRWDGCVSFFSIAGNTYVNLLEIVLPTIMNAGYDIDLIDLRPGYTFEFPEINQDYFTDYLDGATWPIGHQKAGEPITLRDHQVEIIRTAIANPQSLQEAATGAGKTIICAALSHLCEDYGRTLLIVPNRDLVKQTEEDYRNIGLDVGVYYGGRKEIGHKHTICTWQSLEVLKKGDANVEFTMADMIEDVCCVIVDECHQATAEVLKSLLCGPLANIPIRWGLSGTIPKEEHNATSILASIGPTVARLPARELMDLGLLAQCRIHTLQLQDTVEYASFHEEYQFLVTDPTRLDWISQFVIQKALTGNTLVLVNRVETGKQLELRIPGSDFVSGITKGDERQTSYKGMSLLDNKIIIATYGVAAVGINIPRIFNLVIVEPGKSVVRVIQSIGRSIRIAKDKKEVDVYDIASTCKFASKHVAARKKIYKSADYPFTLEKIDYIDQLSKGKIEIKEMKN